MRKKAGFILPTVLVALLAWVSLAAAGTMGIRILAHLHMSARLALGRQALLEETAERIKSESAVMLPPAREEECERDGHLYRLRVTRLYRSQEAPVWAYRIEVDDGRKSNAVTLWLPAQARS